jgi:hypothetical protein
VIFFKFISYFLCERLVRIMSREGAKAPRNIWQGQISLTDYSGEQAKKSRMGKVPELKNTYFFSNLSAMSEAIVSTHKSPIPSVAPFIPNLSSLFSSSDFIWELMIIRSHF